MSPALAEELTLEERSNPWLDAWRRFRRNRAAVASAWIVAAIVVASAGTVAGAPVQRLRIRHSGAR